MRKIPVITFLMIALASLSATSQTKPGGLKVNDMAPGFTALDQLGKNVNLKSLLAKGPVVLVFYRGQWCPYCNKALKSLEDSLSLIMAKGASVVAVTPEKPENIARTLEKTKATYPVLFDEGLKIMKSYDVAFKVDSLTISKYKGYGIDFNVVNGSNGTYLPVPAMYVIDKKGKIVFRHFDADYRKRASIRTILSYL